MTANSAMNAHPIKGKSFSGTSGKTISAFIKTTIDVLYFLGASIGFILQDLYYKAFGFPEKNLNGDIALITGGGGGLGRLLALRFAKLGVTVVIWDINQSGIDETIKEVKSVGGQCYGYIVDISKKEEVYKAAEQIRNDVGDVTLLINNAGVVSGRALLDTPDHLIERSFSVNVLAHFWTTKAFLPAMLSLDRGHIVTIASLAGHVGISKLVDYCSTKFAAVGFDEAVRLELESLGAQGVTTTCICPFFIQATGMFEDVNSRWVGTLKPDEVADRIIVAIQRREKLVMMPNYLKFMLSTKLIFPWGCAASFLKNIVPDAAPQHGLSNGISTKVENNHSTTTTAEQLVSHNNNNNNNNSNKGTPLLVHRTPSIGERVL